MPKFLHYLAGIHINSSLKENGIKHILNFSVALLLFYSTTVKCQTTDTLITKKQTTIGAFLDTYVLDRWDGLDVGASGFYAKDFYRKKKHAFAYTGSLGFYNSYQTENRFIIGAGLQYRFEPFKRTAIRVTLAGNYILTDFLYDRYEYNNQGDFLKQKSTKSNFGPSIKLQYSYDIFRIKSVTFAPVLGYQMIKLDGGNYAKITEGFEFGVSLGILCKF